MAKQKQFEDTFGVKIPKDDQISFADLKNLMVGMGTSLNTNLMKEVGEVKEEMKDFKAEFKDVKKRVDNVTDTVESLKKRIEELENTPRGHAAPDYATTAAVEEAKRIIVFFPNKDNTPTWWRFTEDRRAMQEIMIKLYTNFGFQEEFQRTIVGARCFQTTDGKRTNSIHVEYDSPYQAKRVLTVTKAANSWVGDGERLNTRIFIPGILRDRQNDLEKLAAEMREIGRERSAEKVSTQLRYVWSDLALFVRLQGLSMEWHPVNKSTTAREAIEEIKETIRVKDAQKKRFQERRNTGGKTQTQRTQKRKNDGQVGGGNNLAQTDGIENDDILENITSNDSRRTPRRPNQELRRRRGQTETVSPLFHHNYQAKPILKTHNQPNPVKNSRIKIITIDNETNDVNDDVVVMSVDGVNDNKQITIPQQFSRSILTKQSGTKTYTLNQEGLLRKAAEKFDSTVPYDPKFGDLKNGKYKSITLICNGVYHEVFKNKLLKDLTKGWTKILDTGELYVDGAEPKRDKKGTLESTQVYIRWRNKKTQMKLTAFVFHTTRNIRLQGANAMEMWERSIQPLFDDIINTDAQAEQMAQMAKRNPEAAAQAAAASLGMSPRLTSSITESPKEAKNACSICTKGNCRTNERCKECGRLGHRQCGWMILEGKCKECRNEEKDRKIEASLHIAAGTLAITTERSRDEEMSKRREEDPSLTPPNTRTPAATPTTSPKTPDQQTTEVILTRRHSGWDGHLTEVMDLAATPVGPPPDTIEEAVRSLTMPLRGNPVTNAPISTAVVSFGTEESNTTTTQEPTQQPTRGRKPHPSPEPEIDPMYVSQLLREIAMLRHENESMTTALENQRRARATRAMRELGETQTDQTPTPPPVVVNNKLSLSVRTENLTTENIVADSLVTGTLSANNTPPKEPGQPKKQEMDRPESELERIGESDDEINDLMEPFQPPPETPKTQ